MREIDKDLSDFDRTYSFLRRKSARYIAIGVSSAILNNVVLIGGDFFGFHYTTLTLFCYIFIGAFGYICHARYTFGIAPTCRGYGRYLTALAGSNLIALSLFFIMHDVGGVQMIVVGPFVTIIMFVYNLASTIWAVRFFPRGHPEPSALEN